MNKNFFRYFLVYIVSVFFLNATPAHANPLWPFGNWTPPQPSSTTPAPEKEHFIMPDVIGLPKDEAKQKINAVGQNFIRSMMLTPYENTEAPNEHVYEVKPAPGEKVYDNAEISIKYSNNKLTPEKFNSLRKIPNVVGMTKDEATKVLNDAGWESYTPAGFSTHKIGIKYVSTDPTNSFKNGIVMKATHSQDGRGVVLTILKKDSVAMPYLIGKSYQEAEKILKDMGLFKEVKREEIIYSEDFLKQNPSRKSELHKVVRVTPKAGTMINPDTDNYVWVAEGVPEAEKSIEVPNIGQMKEAEAVALLKHHGLVPQITYEKTSSEFLGGKTSVKTHPKQGSVVKAGNTVKFTVYVYNPKVPFLKGFTLQEAKDKLTALGLKYEIAYKSTMAESLDGQIADCSPKARTQVEPGSTVTITVYKNDQIRVPNLVYMQEQKAVDYMKEHKSKLKYEITYENTVYTSKVGQVCKIDPAYNTIVKPGDTVKLYVNKLLESVPNVIGKTEEQATSELKALDFIVNTIYEEIWDEGQKPGMVIKQGQVAGKPATGLSIYIYVAREPDKVKVPDVAGKSFDTAKWKLKLASADFKPVMQTVKVFDRKKHDRVTATYPGAYSKVKPNSEIAVYVGKLVEYVPNVVGLDKTEAERRLRQEGFHSTVLYIKDGTPGKVVNQSPNANSTPANGKVNLYVAQPAVKINLPTQRETDYIVPFVKGLTVNEARQRLAEVNLNYKINYIQTGRDRHGRILGTSPPPGVKLKPEWKQYVVLNLGWSPFSVPNVVGMSVDQAQKVIENNRMHPRIRNPRPPSNWDRSKKPIVINQKPSAGSPKRGANIEITLIYEAEVPNVEGKSLAEAITLLQDWSLKYKIEFVPVAEGKYDRVVQNAYPYPGQKVPLGETITLKVGKISDAVPDVIGMPEKEAVKTLENCRIYIIREYKDSDTKNNVVLAQSLIPGTSRDQGSITILLGTSSSLSSINKPTPAVKKPSILANQTAPPVVAAPKVMASQNMRAAQAPAPVPEEIKTFYREFKDAYEMKDSYSVTDLISSDWESVDGTTLSDLEDNLTNMFSVFDTMSYTITNLNVQKQSGSKYRVDYNVDIKAQIYETGVTHEEKSSVSEIVEKNKEGKFVITRTLQGKFWR